MVPVKRQSLIIWCFFRPFYWPDPWNNGETEKILVGKTVGSSFRSSYRLKTYRRQLHEDLNLLTVQNRRYVTLLCCVYRHVKSGYIQTVERTEAHTRANMATIIKLPMAWSKQFQNSPFYFGAKMWNALPISLRSAVDLKGFKKELKSLYFSQQSA